MLFFPAPTADLSDFPFSSLCNDDLLSLSTQHSATVTLENPHYDTYIKNYLNDNTADLNSNFDPNDPCGQFNTSQYFTGQNFKSFINSSNLEEDIFLLHLNIRSANKKFDKLKIFLDNNQFPKH